MIKANIYSLEPLAPEARTAVDDGIGMVAAYMGQSIASRDLRVRLPLNERGKANPDRIGFGKLDHLVELHLMAVPLDPGVDERLGVAGIGRGWGFVDTSTNSEQIIRTTAAHEVAHAFGFVSKGAKHADPESEYHCCDGDCIMHSVVKILTLITTYNDAPQAIVPKRRFFGLSRNEPSDSSRPSTRATEITHSVKEQHDFCTDCKIDMNNKGEKHVRALRHSRLTSKKGVS